MPSPFTALLGTPGSRADSGAVIRECRDHGTAVVDDGAAAWAFSRRTTPRIAPPADTLIVLAHLERAFPDGQGGGVRLVLSQPTYQLQRWLDWLATHPGVSVIADLSAAPSSVLQEARARRGPWSRIDLVDVMPRAAIEAAVTPLLEAFVQPSPVSRHGVCVRHAAEDPSPAVLLALASACIEVGRLDEALAALEQARRLAPDWEAVHFEYGKAWLRADDTTRAADAFAEAARLMPSFAAAHANLGAALGELDRPEEALAALDAAVVLDPEGYPAHNSRGACLRDLGQLAEAEAAFHRVIAIRPDFPFGHYNLGQTLFLQGRFAEARRAYEEGLGRDPRRTPWQLARLALVCAALDDGGPAAAHATEAFSAVQPERRVEMATEMNEVLGALAALRGEGTPPGTAIQSLAALIAPFSGPS